MNDGAHRTPEGMDIAESLRSAFDLAHEERWERAVDVLTPVLNRLRATGEDREALLISETLRLLLGMLLEDNWHVAYMRLKEMDLGGDTPGERSVLGLLAYCSPFVGETATETVSLAARALRAERARSAPLFEAMPIYAMEYAEHFDVVRSVVDTRVHDSIASGGPFEEAMHLATRAPAYYKMGSLGHAADDAERCLRIALDHDLPFTIPIAVSILALVEIERGNLEAAGELLDRYKSACLGSTTRTGMYFFVRGRLANATDDHELALHELGRAAENLQRFQHDHPAFYPRRYETVVALIGLGRRDEAAETAADEVTLAQVYGAPRSLGISLRGLADASTGEDRSALLRRSVEALRGSAGRLELARSLFELAVVSREEPARMGLLEEAAEIASSCGASALAIRAYAAMGR